MIKMTNIVKSYVTGGEKLTVLHSIDMEVKKGEFVAILGPSGSGKSTLMNIIGCMDHWDSGEYYLDGVSIHDKKGEQLTKVRNEKIGFIFQKYQLIATYTVSQNVIMPLLARGYSRRKAMEMAKDTIELLGLTERIKHRPSELSGGQQQRVAIARALVGSPAILLADEPTGALDRKTGKEVIALFKRLHDLGNTIVMITHDESVAQNADRIVRIVDGEIVPNPVDHVLEKTISAREKEVEKQPATEAEKQTMAQQVSDAVAQKLSQELTQAQQDAFAIPLGSE
ncbi:MAG: ABC transporter ATP-binding protein [Faecalibacterium sp.]